MARARLRRRGPIAALVILITASVLGTPVATSATPAVTRVPVPGSGAHATPGRGTSDLAALSAQGWGVAAQRLAPPGEPERGAAVPGVGRSAPSDAALGLADLGPPGAGASGNAPPAMWNLQGSGYGHGVGMSQYGARAMATEGWTPAQILRFYYQGTTYDAAKDEMTLVVNLEHAVRSTTVRTSVLSSGGGAFTVAGGGSSMTGSSGDDVTFTRSPSGVTASCADCAGSTRVDGDVVTVRFDDGKTLVHVGSTRYDSGVVTVVPASSGSGLEVGMRVRVHDEYLDSIMEMPWTWPAGALQAQAAAARAYALAAVRDGLRGSCMCHVYDDATDQVFGGYPDADALPHWPAWKAAVRASGSTATGMVPRYQGRVIRAAYSSSNGGATQNSEDVWGGSPIPYLRSVADPWSLKPENPMATWSRPASQAALAAAFGLRNVVRLDLSDRTEGQGVDSARAYDSSGDSEDLDGEKVRERLDLPGTWIRHRGVRIAGHSQATIAATLARAVPVIATAVVLASTDPRALADTVSAPPLAAALDAPILLTDQYALPLPTVSELNRRASGLKRAYLIGGVNSISEDVARQLTARGLDVVRIGGADRYEVSRGVALLVDRIRPVTSVIVVGGAALPDALSAGGAAAALGRPVILTPKEALGEAAAAALAVLKPASAQVLGGENSVRGIVIGQLQQRGIDVLRLAGENRYDVSAKVADFYGPLMPGTKIVLASGEDGMLFDAVLGATLARPTVLGKREYVPVVVKEHLQTVASLGTITVIGSTSRISEDALRGALQS